MKSNHDDELTLVRTQLKAVTQELDLVRAELSEARELVHELFCESAAIEPEDENGIIRFDHAGVMPFRYAQSKLVDWKMISQAECVRE